MPSISPRSSLPTVGIMLLMSATGCASGLRANGTWRYERLPPWLEYHPISNGSSVRGKLASGVVPATPQPAQRAFVSPDGGNMQIAADGSLLRGGGGYGGPLEQLFPPGTQDLAAESSNRIHAVLASGQYSLFDRGSRYDFETPTKIVSAMRGCFATELPASKPMLCYDQRNFNGVDMELVATNTIGPLSRAEWNALKRMDRATLAAWERAGGPRNDAEVLQIDGGYVETRTDQPTLASVLVCGLLADHTVACWGTSQRGELGDGVATMQPRYARVPGLKDVKEIAVGNGFACALTNQGRVACWGRAAGYPQPSSLKPQLASQCKIDEDATEAQYQERRQRSRDEAKSCMQRSCEPGTLDCHLGCVAGDFTREPVYVRDASCIDSANQTPIFRTPTYLDVVGVTSISAGAELACFGYADGRVTCG